MRGTTLAMLSLLALPSSARLAWSQPHDDKERAEVANAMKGARIPLQQGVTARMKDVLRGTEWKTATEKLD